MGQFPLFQKLSLALKMRIYPRQKGEIQNIQELKCTIIKDVNPQSKSETWPVQNENTSIQYPVWFSNTEVSVSVFNLKNTD